MSMKNMMILRSKGKIFNW